MELKDILAISGQPGLYKFIAQSSNGVIVESLVDAKRFNAPSSAKVSSMGEIALYTEGDDMPLNEIFEDMFKHTSGAKAISHKSTPEQIKTLFNDVVPTYDRDRVHVSDMKKIISWFNILVEAGMTDFKIEREQETEEAKQ